MGGATVEGLIKGQQFKNEDITVSDPSQAVVEKFSKMGVSVTTDNKLAAETSDITRPKETDTYCYCCWCIIRQHQRMVG